MFDYGVVFENKDGGNEGNYIKEVRLSVVSDERTWPGLDV